MLLPLFVFTSKRMSRIFLLLVNCTCLLFLASEALILQMVALSCVTGIVNFLHIQEQGFGYLSEKCEILLCSFKCLQINFQFYDFLTFIARNSIAISPESNSNLFQDILVLVSLPLLGMAVSVHFREDIITSMVTLKNLNQKIERARSA